MDILILKEIEKLESRIVEAKESEQNIIVARKVVETICGELYPTIQLFWKSAVKIMFYPNSLSDVKKMIRALGKERYFIDLNYEISENRYISWSFKNKDHGGKISLFAHFDFVAQSCRYVQVGTEKKPVYKLRCE